LSTVREQFDAGFPEAVGLDHALSITIGPIVPVTFLLHVRRHLAFEANALFASVLFPPLDEIQIARAVRRFVTSPTRGAFWR
jgi:hypothetical protein